MALLEFTTLYHGSTVLYIILPWLYWTLLDSTTFTMALLDSTLLDSTTVTLLQSTMTLLYCT